MKRYAALVLAAIALTAAPARAEPAPEVQALAAKIIEDQFKTIINCERCNLAEANFDGQFLRLAALQGANLTGARLRGADITGIHLNRAKLDGANFSGSNMAGAVLTGATLRGADLSNTRLDAVRMSGADFTGANLSGANLRMLEYVKGTKFTNVNARNAIFRHAYLGRVDFTGADLSGADFTRSVGLTNEQLGRACGDGTTILPPGLSIPACGGGK
ncbi:MAG: pentapeptide repeat-containing protein [Parvibaculum sp.]|uniref:pentapeptide repeat-containing protein n=1 Tax=Parvibaculum sp. TaxID=2024848 RepID=UPI002AB84677|nr:pentapeptide repeat-containing protein [Parvibaculum sp.]MDZ4380199.1 pentapeptide repeat-containing protein [Parvibaculum sp.]